MTEAEIRATLLAELPDAEIVIRGEGCNLALDIRSDHFAGRSMLDCHRQVNRLLKPALESGALHALSLKTAVKDP